MTPNADTIKCLQLINSENVGPVTFYKLLERYQTLDNVLEVLPSLKKYRLFAKSAAEREYERAQAAKSVLSLSKTGNILKTSGS